MKTFFLDLKQRKTVSISDIDQIGSFAFDFVEIAKKQFHSSRQITDNEQKLSLQIIAIENIAKPPLISALIPPPLKKWQIDDKNFNFYLKAATGSHELKHHAANQYGTILGLQKYKHWIPQNDLGMLQVIKEKYQHGDSNFPFSEKQAKRLSKKLDKFIDERIESFSMYNSKKSSISFIRRMSLMKIFTFVSQFYEFARTVTDKNLTYIELVNQAYIFKPEEVRFSKPFISFTVANDEDFVEKVSEGVLGTLDSMKAENARTYSSDITDVNGYKIIKSITENSV